MGKKRGGGGIQGAESGWVTADRDVDFQFDKGKNKNREAGKGLVRFR